VNDTVLVVVYRVVILAVMRMCNWLCQSVSRMTQKVLDGFQ